jgi:hypothetical protein
MLIIVSDLHLGDGTCGRSISPAAFLLFADRLEELAYNASWRRDDLYKPLESIDILLMGDILDPLHSTLWLEKEIGAEGWVRPWSDPSTPAYAAMLERVTRAILQHNTDALSVLRRLKTDGLHLTPANRQGLPAKGLLKGEVKVPVRIHYMVGNHDWYYHLPLLALDSIRKLVIDAFGLDNPTTPFPHTMEESALIQDTLERYDVYARHGDIYDGFNYSKARGRDSATLGDVFAMEVLNRFPVELEKRMAPDLPPGLITGLRELTNVRPALATPLWISGQLRRNNLSESIQRQLKRIWDDLGHQFISLDFVRAEDKKFKLDIVDGLEMLVSLTRRASFKTLDDIVLWLRQKVWSGDISFAQNALREPAFLERKAQFIVYGHTHHHEIVSLDTIPERKIPTSQLYLNSGTWHTYYDLAVYKPEEQTFIPYEVLTYLAFYKEDERGGRRFETWSGAFSN